VDRIEGERLVAAALLIGPELVISLPRPARHCDVMRAAADLDLDVLGAEQGFLSSEGRFVRRCSGARRIAERAGQLIRKPISNVFTSEELW